MIYYIRHEEGSLIGLKDNDGNIITETSHIGAVNPFRYRSYYYDNETKLYYLNSRYYNPEWGRFINADGIIGANRDILGYNLYAYVSNNPIKNSDSNGKGKTWDWIAIKTYDLYKKAREAVSKVFGTKTYVSTPIEGSYCTMDNKIAPGINIKSGMVEVCSIGDDKPITFYSEISGMPGVGVEFNVMNLNVNLNSSKNDKSIGVAYTIKNDNTYGLTVGIDASKLSIYVKADYSYKIDNNNSIHNYFRTDVNIFYLLPVPIKTIEFNPYPFVKYAFN